MMPADTRCHRLLATVLICFSAPLAAQEAEPLDPAFLEFLALEADTNTDRDAEETGDDTYADSLALASWLSWWEKPAVEEEKDDE